MLLSSKRSLKSSSRSHYILNLSGLRNIFFCLLVSTAIRTAPIRCLFEDMTYYFMRGNPAVSPSILICMAIILDIQSTLLQRGEWGGIRVKRVNLGFNVRIRLIRVEWEPRYYILRISTNHSIRIALYGH